MAQTIATPVKPFLQLAGPRRLVAGAFVGLGALVPLMARGRR